MLVRLFEKKKTDHNKGVFLTVKYENSEEYSVNYIKCNVCNSGKSDA